MHTSSISSPSFSWFFSTMGMQWMLLSWCVFQSQAISHHPSSLVAQPQTVIHMISPCTVLHQSLVVHLSMMNHHSTSKGSHYHTFQGEYYLLSTPPPFLTVSLPHMYVSKGSVLPAQLYSHSAFILRYTHVRYHHNLTWEPAAVLWWDFILPRCGRFRRQVCKPASATQITRHVKGAIILLGQ